MCTSPSTYTGFKPTLKKNYRLRKLNTQLHRKHQQKTLKAEEFTIKCDLGTTKNYSRGATLWFERLLLQKDLQDYL